MTAAAIEFRQVSKTYKKMLGGMKVPALTDVSFAVAPGEVCAFLGPNGAGKTTSISILMGFLYADWGRIRVLGHEPGDIRAKAKIGFVPENFAFYKHLNAEKLLRFHGKLSGLPEERTSRLIGELIAKVRLDGYERLKIGRYSRGMVQRLGIAQALLASPELLVMDEPTSGLDPSGRKEVRDIILGLKAAGKTIFLSSHLLSEVEQICDQAVIVDRGRVVRSGAMKQLLATGDQVQIVASGVSEEIVALLKECGATLEALNAGVRIVVTSDRKREVVEKLWEAGQDVISLHPVKGSLEDLYMKLVGSGGAT
jgi:ABC-2 type transport system ATP-binding protein